LPPTLQLLFMETLAHAASPRGMTQGAQNMFFGGVALLVSLATFIQGGKVPAQFLETLSYRGRGLKLIT